jgi:hypothetical protein
MVVASGGARAKSGPLADRHSRSQARDRAGWTVLPKTWGEEPPEFPIPVAVQGTRTDREMQLWSELWSRGQAKMWLAMGLEYQVAIYCKLSVQIERMDKFATPPKLTVWKQLAEELGLNPSGMARNKWYFAEEDESASGADVVSIARRFDVIDGSDSLELTD